MGELLECGGLSDYCSGLLYESMRDQEGPSVGHADIGMASRVVEGYGLLDLTLGVGDE